MPIQLNTTMSIYRMYHKELMKRRMFMYTSQDVMTGFIILIIHYDNIVITHMYIDTLISESH